MSYKAIVIQVMIASPSDVKEEREIIREVLFDWNYTHSRKREAVVMPVSWETHYSPELGTPGQALINERVLKDCDLLIGVFSTRLGTPTVEFMSGTVEEINKHVREGKPAMIYFSSGPVSREAALGRNDQLRSIEEFRAKCKNNGLIGEYKTIEDLRVDLRKRLEIALNENPYLSSLIDKQSDSAVASTARKAFQNNGDVKITPMLKTSTSFDLSDEAKELLGAASEDKDGHILVVGDLQGQSFIAGNKNLGGESARDAARYKRALRELIAAFLIERANAKGSLFQLTDKGWTNSDTISGNK